MGRTIQRRAATWQRQYHVELIQSRDTKILHNTKTCLCVGVGRAHIRVVNWLAEQFKRRAAICRNAFSKYSNTYTRLYPYMYTVYVGVLMYIPYGRKLQHSLLEHSSVYNLHFWPWQYSYLGSDISAIDLPTIEYILHIYNHGYMVYSAYKWPEKCSV